METAYNLVAFLAVSLGIGSIVLLLMVIAATTKKKGG